MLCITNEPHIDSFPINLFAKCATLYFEPGRGRGRTCEIVDVGAVMPIAGGGEVARIARACEGAAGVGARRVGTGSA